METRNNKKKKTEHSKDESSATTKVSDAPPVGPQTIHVLLEHPAKKVEREAETYSSDLIVRDPFDGIVIRYWKNAFDKSLMKKLVKSTQELVKSSSPPHIEKERMTDYVRAYYLGMWKGENNEPYLTKDTNSDAMNWIKKNKELFARCSDVFKEQFPLLHKSYQEATESDNMFNALTTAILNINSPCEGKCDLDMRRHRSTTFNFVIPFGDDPKEKKEIYFPYLGIRIEAQMGDLIAISRFDITYKVSSLKKKNEKVNGKSLVLFTPVDMFNLRRSTVELSKTEE